MLGAGALRGRVLNVGCGTGGFNAAAAAAGARVVGVDADADAIAICALRRGAGLGFTRAAGESLPFSGGAFDLVHCFLIERRLGDATIVRWCVTRQAARLRPRARGPYEGHYTPLWTPFLPGWTRLPGFEAARWLSRDARRLTRGAIVRTFAAARPT